MGATDRFPVAGRVGTSVGEHFQSVIDPAHALTFGLTRILDGISLLIADRTPPPAGEQTLTDPSRG